MKLAEVMNVRMCPVFGVGVSAASPVDAWTHTSWRSGFRLLVFLFEDILDKKSTGSHLRGGGMECGPCVMFLAVFCF